MGFNSYNILILYVTTHLTHKNELCGIPSDSNLPFPFEIPEVPTG